MAWVWALLLLLSSLCVKQSSSIISLGSSLSSATQSIPWRSPSGRFAFGFYSQGGGLSVGVWLDGGGKNDNKVVWTANRDDPPVTSNATLILNENGVLLSIAVSGEKNVIASPNNSAISVFSASMLDSGNFVLYNKDNHTIWESFKQPTDTLLGGQTLLTNHELISSSSENDHSPGRFHLSMQLDGNLVLYPRQSEDSTINAYWSTNTFGMGLSLRLFLNATGLLQLINNDNSSIYKTINLSFYPEPTYNDYNESSSNNNSTVFSASLDVDGNFRLYAYLFERDGGFQTYPLLRALLNSCKVRGFCGLNSYCTFNDNRPYCACLPGTDFIDPLQNNLGCKRNYSEAHCKGGKANIPFYNMTSMPGLEWTTGSFYGKERLSKDACSRTCLEDCNCEAAQFDNGICRKQKLPLSETICTGVRPRDKWFNLALRECPSALKNFDLCRQSNFEPVMIDVNLEQKPLDWDPVTFSPKSDLVKHSSSKDKNSFFWNSDKKESGCKAKGEKVIESWFVQHESRKGRDCSSGSRRSSYNNLSALFKKLILMLRSLYVTVRLLPVCKIFRDLNSSGQIRAFKLVPRVSSSVESFT
ncbi:hypothetical protein PVK06_010648 [Gossypium arboreum]|uniref:Bulb-type lectin domain-containing protein n=1 Tax=Gossypium arboreum TaxID=29729 RepID=A0ABR0Q7J2_GOSAR|nr:hypothetical protein PVK06_010648 [Gossypium arboreum]